MGKRSDFERKPRDLYLTPPEAVPFLLPHLVPQTKFDEPCAANGAFAGYLQDAGHICTSRSDIQPLEVFVEKRDALNIRDCRGEMFITNLPWDRAILHQLIDSLSKIAPLWILLDADWSYTVQKSMAKKANTKTVPELMKFCQTIIAVGRVSWEQNGKKGKENCAWYLFDQSKEVETIFIGRK